MEWFGEGARQLMSGRNMSDTKDTILDKITDKKIFKCQMLHARMVDRITREVDNAKVVAVEDRVGRSEVDEAHEADFEPKGVQK
ncbi:unnamed protein product [Linum trigynum]|uniref:Uncharacterized protein n=1 Tax=Linum trigynum TaxID=586398 RepID=A0AAV2FD11_9ROSI